MILCFWGEGVIVWWCSCCFSFSVIFGVLKFFVLGICIILDILELFLDDFELVRWFVFSYINIDVYKNVWFDWDKLVKLLFVEIFDLGVSLFK